MTNIKIDSNSVNKYSYTIYADASSSAVVAINKSGKEKIEKSHQKYKEFGGMPESEVVRGVVLKQNSKNGNHQMVDEYLNEFKIRNLFFPKIEWT